MSTPQPAYRLVRRPPAGRDAPALDAAQQAVVDHPGGPLLVLAGPGTGKTTTIVEAVVERVERRGVDPERVLALTFSRRAATELRERVTARLGRTTREPLARTFHSYAFGLLRREAALLGEPAPRLLAGPEQDLLVRELLAGDAEGLGTEWPEELRGALRTRGFAQELRDLVTRCHERGVGPEELLGLAVEHGRADWRAAAAFLGEYEAVGVLGDAGAHGPAELVRAVADRMGDPGDTLRERERRAYDWVFVDEYQDTDPAQEELLRHLVPPGGNLVAVGDPNQSIYAFRGADVGCVRRFPDLFAGLDGTPTAQVRLVTCRRSAPAVLAAGRAVADRLRGVHTHTGLAALPGRAPGRVDVHLAGSPAQEAATVAGVLRRAHLADGVPWSRMAVLVRSAQGPLGGLRRALLGAGVPVRVGDGELALAEQPGLRPLLDLLGVALRPDGLDEPAAVALLTGPLGGLDALALRRLRRELRRIELTAGGARPSGALLVEALLSPVELLLVPDAMSRPVERLAGLLALARSEATRRGATAESLLWSVWEASGLGPRWQGASMAGGPAGAAADRDLDAAMALFEAAGRFVDRLPKAGPEVFLDQLRAQEVPGDTLAGRAPVEDAVRVLTAHGSKGLEWDVVVVAGVQDGVWPDLRLRGTLLGTERLVDALAGVDATPGSATSRLLEEERRLFYVACTRAREQLVVTAVSDGEEGEQPSRFLADLPLPEDGLEVLAPADAAPGAGGATGLGELRRTLPAAALLARARQLALDPRQPAATREGAARLVLEGEGLARALDLTALVGELRGVVTDPAAPGALRSGAAARLARLGAAGVPAADPSSWYAALALSDPRPLRDPGDPVRVNPSKVEQFRACELRWLLESVGGTPGQSAVASLGTLVHDLASLATDPAVTTEEEMLRRLDGRWEALDTGGPWWSARQRELALSMIRRFLGYHRGCGRELVATEVDFEVRVGRAVLRGRVDRLERDPAGRGVVVDLKTGTGKPRPHELGEHPQLGVYQLAVELGAFAREHGLRESGGASLVHLGKAGHARAHHEQSQPPLAETEDPGWARALILLVAEGMGGANFLAVQGRDCDRCPVRRSCPLQDGGRQVVGP